MLYLFVWLIAVLLIILAIICLSFVFSSPFDYPYFKIDFDVSGKRKPNIEDYIDKFLIDDGMNKVKYHCAYVKEWKEASQEKLKHYKMKKYRAKQYAESLDDEHMFTFALVRSQTRYKQSNYVKKAYKVPQTQEEFSCNFEYLVKRDSLLAKIGYECPLRLYHSSNQRKLMTPELKRRIMERDNYTCQFCGRYMPDEFGLEIDHIVPISKGGKTVESNLQVLCSKCNRSKSNK